MGALPIAWSSNAPNGLYTAPAATSAVQTVAVTATIGPDSTGATRSASTTVTIPAAPLGGGTTYSIMQTLEGAPAGLTTVGYTLYGAGGSVYRARTTSGVSQYAPGTYAVNLTLPVGNYGILWDTGGASPQSASEAFTLGAATSGGTATGLTVDQADAIAQIPGLVTALASPAHDPLTVADADLVNSRLIALVGPLEDAVGLLTGYYAVTTDGKTVISYTRQGNEIDRYPVAGRTSVTLPRASPSSRPTSSRRASGRRALPTTAAGPPRLHGGAGHLAPGSARHPHLPLPPPPGQLDLPAGLLRRHRQANPDEPGGARRCLEGIDPIRCLVHLVR